MNDSKKIRYIYAELKEHCNENTQEILELANKVREIYELSTIDVSENLRRAEKFVGGSDIRLADSFVDDFMTASASDIFKYEREIVTAVFEEDTDSGFCRELRKNKLEELFYG